ncbi:hypothetical protein PUN28_020021 [Cardiocondyla obscurior]|uniref:Uncharacterized protein n=1 Tax=Cardiocondyla obscurior TaxID=286306 RepID=A0AAW2E6U7_9HYME
MINEDINISASDFAVTKRLKSWGLSAEVIQAFKDQKIMEEVFPYLDKDTINLLIPFIGERILFNLKYKAELNNKIYTDTSVACASDENSDIKIIATTDTSGEAIIIQEPALNEIVNQNINILDDNIIQHIPNNDLELQNEKIDNRYVSN